MSAWWVTFADKNATEGCVEATTKDAAEKLAAEIMDMDVYHIACLPYPAAPRLNHLNGLSGSPCPSFCISPARCAGHGCCPRDPACSS